MWIPNTIFFVIQVFHCAFKRALNFLSHIHHIYPWHTNSIMKKLNIFWYLLVENIIFHKYKLKKYKNMQGPHLKDNFLTKTKNIDKLSLHLLGNYEKSYKNIFLFKKVKQEIKSASFLNVVILSL